MIYLSAPRSRNTETGRLKFSPNLEIAHGLWSEWLWSNSLRGWKIIKTAFERKEFGTFRTSESEGIFLNQGKKESFIKIEDQ